MTAQFPITRSKWRHYCWHQGGLLGHKQFVEMPILELDWQNWTNEISVLLSLEGSLGPESHLQTDKTTSLHTKIVVTSSVRYNRFVLFVMVSLIFDLVDLY